MLRYTIMGRSSRIYAARETRSLARHTLIQFLYAYIYIDQYIQTHSVLKPCMTCTVICAFENALISMTTRLGVDMQARASEKCGKTNNCIYVHIYVPRMSVHQND